MSEQISEQISALLDGELPEAELSLLLRQIERQPELLQQAQAVQQARLCVQGEQPLSLSESIDFSTRVQNAIREETVHQASALKSGYAQDAIEDAIEEGTARAAFSSHEDTDELSLKRLSKKAFSNNQVVSNENRWRPIFGAGIAAAVALVAVNAWQTQAPASDTLEPGSIAVENDSFSNLAVPTQAQTQPAVNVLQVNSVASPATPEAQDSSSYTVPNFDDLNVDSSLAFNNDFRQVSYADYLLQNNLAPQSTSRQLSRFAEEQRANIYKEQIYIDPQTGDIIYSIRPIIK